MQKPLQSSAVFVALAVLVLAGIRLVAAAFVPISPDEAYYFDWSRFPAWGYYDHPPMVAWWIAAATALFGDSPLAIRALTVLSIIPATAAIYVTGRVLFDHPAARRAALWLNATLLVAVGGFIATPDAPSLLFWTIAVMGFALIVRTGNGGWWLLVGLAAGLGVDSKLTGLFLGLGILLALVAERDLRRWLVSPWTWAGVLVALVVIAPVAVWNAHHGWVTLGQFARVGAGGLQPLKLPEYIATQFGLLNPLVAVFVGLAIAVWIGNRRGYPVGGIGVPAWTALPLIVYMAFHALHQQVQGNWLAPIYPTLALMAAASAGAAPPERWGGWRALAFPVGAILTVVGLVFAANPGNVLPFPTDAGRQLRGWDGVATDTATLRRLTESKWIGAAGYDLAAELAYRLRGTAPVVPITGRIRYAYAPLPDPALLAEPGLILAEDGDLVTRCFPGAVHVGDVMRRSGGERIATFAAFTVTGSPPAAFDPGCDRVD